MTVVFIDAQARRTQHRGTCGTGWFFRLSSKTVNCFFKGLPSTFHDLKHQAIILFITCTTLNEKEEVFFIKCESVTTKQQKIKAHFQQTLKPEQTDVGIYELWVLWVYEL